MNTKYLMMASSLVTGVLGFVSSFLPKEILNYAGFSATETAALFVQVTGALYIGFAVMNWMAKTVLIGGIYARPLAMGNFAHFIIAGIALVKACMNNSVMMYLWILAVLYSIFAVLFGVVLFTSPIRSN